MTDSGDPQFSEVLTLYCGCMEEIKLRVDVVHIFLSGQLSLKSPPLVESVCLQVRKILELIALASLVAIKDEYSRQSQKFDRAWHAARILKDIEKINPSFYPIPTRQVLDPVTGRPTTVENVNEGYLTRDEFVTVYKSCSEMLHAKNPFGPPKDVQAIARAIPIWLDRIMTLLNHHQIQLIKPDLQLWVLMQAVEDGRVHAFVMKKKPILF